MPELYGRHWTRAELIRYVGDISQVAGIRPVVFQDGPEAGVRALEFRTGGGLAFTVLAERAMDIGLAEVHGVPVSFLSPVGYVHPSYFEGAGMGWLRTFQGGLFVTCGLDTSGSPSIDEGVEYGIHGRITAVPARNLCYDAEWEGDDYILRARGRMHQVAAQGESLRLTREITARLGENRFSLYDVVENLGARPQAQMIIYHFNIGFPLLDEGAELLSGKGPCEGWDEQAQRDAAGCRQVQAPSLAFPQQVFLHHPTPGPDGRVTAAVVNRRFRGGQGLGFAVRFFPEELPYLWQWRSFIDREYVMGVEPSNGDIRGRAYTREQGRLVTLEPGEQRSFRLEVEIVDTPEGIARLEQEAGR